MSDQREISGNPERRRSKLIGFLIAEASAIAVLVVAGIFALSPAVLNGSVLAISVNIITIVAAAAVAIIPILFFAIAPVMPSGDR